MTEPVVTACARSVNFQKGTHATGATAYKRAVAAGPELGCLRLFIKNTPRPNLGIPTNKAAPSVVARRGSPAPVPFVTLVALNLLGACVNGRIGTNFLISLLTLQPKHAGPEGARRRVDPSVTGTSSPDGKEVKCSVVAVAKMRWLSLIRSTV